jgi:hypothetical protein
MSDFPPLEAAGRTYLLSWHATERAEHMGVPIQLIPHIIANGTRHEAPEGSKYAGCYVYRAGKVAVAIRPDQRGDIITTILWATVDAWRDAEHKAGRTYRGDEHTRRVLTAWFGAAA